MERSFKDNCMHTTLAVRKIAIWNIQVLNTVHSLCPTCGEPININPNCDKGHSYALRNSILHLLSGASDETILEEEKHWDRFSQMVD